MIKGGPPNTLYTTSPFGFMESYQFLQWLDEMFIPHIKKSGGHRVLLLDGHSTHVSLRVALMCKENNITLICIQDNIDKSKLQICQTFNNNLITSQAIINSSHSPSSSSQTAQQTQPQFRLQHQPQFHMRH